MDVYDVGGLEALLKRYNDPESVDGDWYIYVLDLEGTIIAHPTIPELRGQSVLGPVGVDITGVRFGPDLLQVTEEGSWITYYFRNPNGASCELKHSWAVRPPREVIIASGWYEDTVPQPPLPSKCELAAYTVATVEQAVARYRAEGPRGVHHLPQLNGERGRSLVRLHPRGGDRHRARAPRPTSTSAKT